MEPRICKHEGCERVCPKNKRECNSCSSRKYRQADEEKYKAQTQKHYQKYKERKKEYMEKYQVGNKENKSLTAKARHIKNKISKTPDAPF